MVQKNYVYGCNEGECEFYVYRITNTNPDGVHIELSWGQIKDFCTRYELKHVPEYYYGYAKDLYKDIIVDEDWATNVLNRMMTDFNLEKDCEFNKKGIPAEGVVIRPDRLFECSPVKLKSFRFLERETKELDSGEVDIETNETTGDE